MEETQARRRPAERVEEIFLCVIKLIMNGMLSESKLAGKKRNYAARDYIKLNYLKAKI